MFHQMPKPIRDRMAHLRELDRADRESGAAPSHRLHQVPPETGRLLAILAASTPDGICLEIGTGGGYSALWLSLACRERGNNLATFEILEEKARLAAETFRAAGVNDVVELVKGDARKLLSSYRDIAFCFLDAEKKHYLECYELVVPNMVRGGILVADNIISHRDALERFLARAMADERLDSVEVPIGQGLLVCRRL